MENLGSERHASVCNYPGRRTHSCSRIGHVGLQFYYYFDFRDVKKQDRPIYIIVDALDECSNFQGRPSAREEIPEFVEDIVNYNFRMSINVWLAALRWISERCSSRWL